MSKPSEDLEEIEVEADGDMELLRSSDKRYIELRIWSKDPIESEGFLAVLDRLVESYASDPERVFEVFGKPMPEPGDMN